MSDSAPDSRTDRVTIPIRVRYAECDPMQIAHHGSYPLWMEMGRTELLRANHDDGVVINRLANEGKVVCADRLP